MCERASMALQLCECELVCVWNRESKGESGCACACVCVLLWPQLDDRICCIDFFLLQTVDTKWWAKSFSPRRRFLLKRFFANCNFFADNNNNKQVFRSIFLLLRPPTNSSLAKRTCQLLICPFRFFFASSIGGEAKEKPERHRRRSQKALFAKRKTQRSSQFLMRLRQLVGGSTGLGDSL